MPTSPPRELDGARPCVVADLDAARFEAHAGDEGIIFFCVENAPPSACGTHSGADGSLTFWTRLRGRILEVRRDAFVLAMSDHLVTVRHHLPSGVLLDALAGRIVELALTQTYRGRGRATIDVVLHDEDGRTVLWAHDGRHPDDRDAHGLSLRAMLEENTARLAVRTDTGVATVACPGILCVESSGRSWHLALVRLAADDIGFLLMRR